MASCSLASSGIGGWLEASLLRRVGSYSSYRPRDGTHTRRPYVDGFLVRRFLRAIVITWRTVDTYRRFTTVCSPGRNMSYELVSALALCWSRTGLCFLTYPL